MNISSFSQEKESIDLVIENDEYWWGGLSSLGYETPYNNNSEVTVNLFGDNHGNQAQPLLVSSKGRYVWCESPVKYSISNGILSVSSNQGKIHSGTSGSNLQSAYKYVSQNYFPSNSKIPDELLFTNPQYNTWIELMYDQNEDDIIEYAQSIIDNGYPPGVLMIDDNWQEDYGTWEFSSRRFNDPKRMMKKLHDMGFKVMLWVCPFVSADSQVFRKLAADGLLLLDAGKTQEVLWANTRNKAAIIRWWNGASACLDLSNPKTKEWFKGRLDYLMDEYGVDGFKFDAGDAQFYKGGLVSFNESSPNDHTQYFAELGLDYPLNEYRASWKMAGLPLAQRLRDKGHRWEDLEKLIPDQMSQSVMGYAYTCPDMIGGGEYQSFLNASSIDEELIVRSAQVHALMPMMQFSVAPWRVLNKTNERICHDMANLHKEFGSHILKLAKEASVTGNPIVKPMELAFPGNGYETIKDQFVLGNDIIVAPVIEKGARTRNVVLPKGQWIDEQGKKYRGGEKVITIDVPLKRLPYFKKIK
ncbi:Glycosyl hydrolases family 31 [Lutibacter agarilyticus]|uniref:Glycosyl hydrolases family 31 n=2 Tax=Lutibacter agarilyticus TaxID=1109740 RepID=A0A238X7E2_9FLAO|nr:Glycosyl hydrolases family 31 [Lutibacter agarilyticus]